MAAALEILTDVCTGLPMTIRKMFGGHGFFAPNGGMFAGIVSDDLIILKLADDAAREELIGLGGRPWTYHGKHKPMTMRDWIVVPSEFHDDFEQFSAWARRAHALVPGKIKAGVKTPAPQKKAPTKKKKRP